jgi:hypothetical protein
VHEANLKLVDQTKANLQHRVQFFSAAAQIDADQTNISPTKTRRLQSAFLLPLFLVSFDFLASLSAFIRS